MCLNVNIPQFYIIKCVVYISIFLEEYIKYLNEIILRVPKWLRIRIMG